MKKDEDWLKKYPEKELGIRYGILTKRYGEKLMYEIKLVAQKQLILEEMEDILFFTILKVDKRFCKPPPVDNPLGYLKTAAKNTTITKLKKRGLSIVGEYDIDNLISDTLTYEQSERSETIRELLKRLGENCLGYFLQRYQGGKKLVEIAEDLGIEKATMRSRFRNCKNSFLQIIKDSDYRDDFEDIL